MKCCASTSAFIGKIEGTLMRALIQRVTEASVSIDEELVGKIDKGLLILLGVGQDDTQEIAQKLWAKIEKMRIFADENVKTNLSLADIEGSVLVVSQFTLYANCKKGNRPSFVGAGTPEKANTLYEYFASLARTSLGEARVGTGQFGADMQVSIINDGPFTIWLDTDYL
jgi:D-aminoacyl-tRNA deacylase